MSDIQNVSVNGGGMRTKPIHEQSLDPENSSTTELGDFTTKIEADSKSFNLNDDLETEKAAWPAFDTDEPKPARTEDDEKSRKFSDLQRTTFIFENNMIGDLQDIKSLVNRNPKTVSHGHLVQLTRMLHTIWTRQLVPYFEDNLNAYVQREGGARSAVTIESILDWWANGFFLPPTGEIRASQDTELHTSPTELGIQPPDRPLSSSDTVFRTGDDSCSGSFYMYRGFDGGFRTSAASAVRRVSLASASDYTTKDPQRSAHGDFGGGEESGPGYGAGEGD
ncbi:hypothetical protein J7T55_003229 [Diaporthe amygdali]|uniref:uncharacterized protein n=1 Tax=Phomopsis amygdali TaxID=1214568 RepID=UPI0022FE7700|nr:uncharacterized protein J7T55_003229 [Diaporthe amygdali]KAJ0122713.1 hypothetical protein J7T55_003229 [Diaporthe amygdali]